jgi:hypothetical protein
MTTLKGEVEYEAELYENEVEGGLTPGMTNDKAEWDNIYRSGSSSSGRE